MIKIALLVLLGLVLGALGGAALGIGAGLAWFEIFKTTDFEGYSGMLVFFTFMPFGAVMGGVGGALLFAVIAIRDAEIAVERQPAGEHSAVIKTPVCAAFAAKRTTLPPPLPALRMPPPAKPSLSRQPLSPPAAPNSTA